MHEIKFNLRIPHSAHILLAQLDMHQTSKPVMVSIVSPFYTKIPEMSDMSYLGKTCLNYYSSFLLIVLTSRQVPQNEGSLCTERWAFHENYCNSCRFRNDEMT